MKKKNVDLENISIENTLSSIDDYIPDKEDNRLLFALYSIPEKKLQLMVPTPTLFI